MSKVVKAAAAIGFIALGAFTGGVAFLPGTALAFTVSASTFLVMGLALAASLLSPTPGRNRAASAASLQIGEVPRQAVLGRSATAGSLVDAFNYGGKYETDWEVLVIALADHRCDALESVIVNDTVVPFAGDGAVAGYNGQLEVHFRDGRWDQDVPAVLLANGPGWTANDRGRGVCYAVVAYKADAADAKNPVWPGGRPRFRFVLRGLRCYQARKDSSVGGSGVHRRDNPATWEWTENLIDIRYNWVRGIYAGDLVGQPEMLLVGRGLSAIEAPPQNVFARANLCDELVGGEPRYRIGGMVDATEPYIDVESDFAAACAGVIVQPEGSVEIDPGEARAPVAHFTDDDLLVGSNARWSDFLGDGDPEWINTAVALFTDPQQLWRQRSAPPRRDVADIAADGRPREAQIALSLVSWTGQAQRVAEIARRFGRLWGRGSVTLPPRYSGLEEGDWVTWQSNRRFGGATRTFRVEAWSSSRAWHHQLTLRQISASVFSDTAPLDDGSVVQPQPARGPVSVPGAAAWSVTPGTLEAGGIRTPALIVSGAVDDPAASAVRIEYHQGVAAPGPAAQWNDAGLIAPDTTRREIPVAAGGTYYVAVSHVVEGATGDRRVIGPVVALAMGWPDGTPLEDLQPANPGATAGATLGADFKSPGDVIYTQAQIETLLGTANAVVGQGSGATANTLAQLNAAEGTKLTGIAAGATNDTGADTRDDDFTPMHYRAGWERRLRTEFKTAAAIGLTTASTFVTLESYAAWNEPSGGPVWQRATDKFGIRYIRFSQGATGAETWTAWKAEFSENRKPAFGGDLLESAGGVAASLAGFKTSLGTAAAIAGQGSGATANTLAQLNAAEGTKLTGIAAGATNDTGADTRDDDFTPMHYRAGWERRLRTEFKTAAAIGLTTASTFVTLESYAAWNEPSGGPVWQRATDKFGIRYIRFSQGATGAETWTAWKAEFSENRKPAFGGDLLESAGGVAASLAGFKTSLGTAAAIAGQAAAATDPTIEPGADVTATAQRAIVPQFPVIEIRQGEAGHTGDRAVTHAAKKGTAALAGGTWSLPSANLGAGSAAINAGTGTVTLSGIVGSGAYTVRYTHTDGIATDLAVNVTYVPLVAAGTGNSATSATKLFSTSGFTAISNAMTIALPAGVTTASLLAADVLLEVANALPAGATDVEVKWQRETSPGTWADVGAPAASSPSPGVVDEGGFPSASAGSVTCNRTASALPAGSTQTFRLVARISGGTIRTVTPFGAVTVGG